MKRLFEGYECEGVLKGLWTLFVQGEVPVSEIIARAKNYSQIYFGAGNQSHFNLAAVIEVAKLFPVVVTVETEKNMLPELAQHSNLRVVIPLWIVPAQETLTSYMKTPSMWPRVQLKFDTAKHSVLMPLSMCTVNSMSEIHHDVMVWEEK